MSKKSKAKTIVTEKVPADSHRNPKLMEVAPGVTEEIPPEPEPVPMSTFEKVSLMNDLAKLIKDPDFEATVLSRESGEYIFQIFKTAAETTIEGIMNNTVSVQSQQEEQQAISLLQSAREAANVINDFRYLMGGFAQTPLVSTLQMLSNNLSGEQPPEDDYYEPELEPVQQRRPPPQRPAPRRKPQPPEQRRQQAPVPPPKPGQQAVPYKIDVDETTREETRKMLASRGRGGFNP